jgi:uncharacterized protein (DUF1015 family)
MATVQPFPGICYGKQTVPDFGMVICPPYDIISPVMREELYRRSPYNFVRLEFNHEFPGDNPEDNKYTRARDTLREWRARGILVEEARPVFYLYDQWFTRGRQVYRRRSLIGAVRLEEWRAGIIRPHEGTLFKPKDDRLRLLRALQMNTSPVLALYEDPESRIARVLGEQAALPPLLDFLDPGGERHQVWAVGAPGAVKVLERGLAGQPFYIADGHHRYESALNYRRERQAASPPDSDFPYNYVMMTLVSFDDPGLLVLPYHRMVSDVGRDKLENLVGALEAYFDIEAISFGGADPWTAVEAAQQAEREIVKIGLFGPAEGRFLSLRLREAAAAAALMPQDRSVAYRGLAVSLVDHLIMERLLGVGGVAGEAQMTYTADRIEATARVMRREVQLAVIMNPLNVREIKAVADAGDRMPKKSTYFYPKLPSGLVCHSLNVAV